jgi:hypothetical protein
MPLLQARTPSAEEWVGVIDQGSRVIVRQCTASFRIKLGAGHEVECLG